MGELEEIVEEDLEFGKNGEESTEKCPSCGSKDIVEREREFVCAGCGLVIQGTVDRGPEWRAFSLEEKLNKSRIGAPVSNKYYDKNLSTTFNPKDVGDDLEKNRKMWRLKKWDKRTKLGESDTRNLSRAFLVLSKLIYSLNIPSDVGEEAHLIYRKALGKDLIKGKTILGFACASLYGACRKSNRVDRTLKEIADINPDSSMKEISRDYRELVWEDIVDPGLPDYENNVSTIANRMNLRPPIQEIAADVIREAGETGTRAGKDPRGLAASSLYIACRLTGEKRTQKNLAEVAGTTEVTIRNRYKELLGELDVFVPL